MGDVYIQNELTERGYQYLDGQLTNISSLNQLMQDMLNINTELLKNPQVQLTLQEQAQFPFAIKEPFTFVVPDAEVRRQTISDQVFPNNKYPVISNSPDFIAKLNEMFRLYDYWFFGGLLAYALNKRNGSVTFEVTPRMTSVAGSCSTLGICTYLIKLSSEQLKKLTPQNLYMINGIIPQNRVEGLQLVFEHELLHMILSLFINDISGHNQLFKDIAKMLFGHTDFRHQIGREVQEGAGKYSRGNLNVGDEVSYIASRTNQPTHGTVIKLNPKRARIRTVEGVFNVPYSMLTRIKGTVAAAAPLRKTATRADFSLNERVGFRSPTLGLVSGTIIKLNPKRAVVYTERGEYSVSYEHLSRLD